MHFLLGIHVRCALLLYVDGGGNFEVLSSVRACLFSFAIQFVAVEKD